MAAIAVLAVAFVVLAAVPAVDATGDGAGTTEGVTKANPIEITDFTGFTNALANGGDYILKNDISGTIDGAKTVSKSVSIDLNGKTIVLTGGNTITASGCTLEFKSTDKVGTLKYNGFSSTTNAALSADASGILTLDSIKFETNGSAVYPYGDASKATIKNSEIVAGAYAVGTNNAKTGTNKLSIEIENSTLTTNGEVKDNATVMINAQGVTLSIKNSTLTGDRQTLFVRAGTATVENTQINFNDAFTGKISAAEGKWGTGNEVASAAVVVGDKGCDNAYAGTAKLTLKGGEIKATSGTAVVTSTDANTGYELIIGNETATKVSIGSNSVSITGLKAVETGFSISEGSVVITGSMTATDANSRIAQAEGDVVLKDLTITTGILTIDKVVGVQGDLAVASGATVAVADKATLTVASGATMSVSGTLTISEKATVTVAGNLEGQGTFDNKGVVESLNGGNITAEVGGKMTSRTDDSQMENVSIEGTVKGTDNVFDKDQLATVKGNSVMAEDSKLVINGKLYIPEGATLTLMPGAQLVLQNNAVLEVEGKLIIEEPYDSKVAKIDVVSGKIIVSGSVEDGGEINVTSGSVEIKADGAVIVGEAGKLVSSKVSVEESATLQVNGALGATAIENAGTVIFDSMVASEKVTISMKNGGAVDVKNLTLKKDGTVTIKDELNNIILKADTVTLKKIKAEDGTETDVVLPTGAYAAAVISGITITEQVTSKTENNQTNYTYVMDISGNAAVDYVYVAAGDENEPEVDKIAASITLAGSSVGKNGITVTGALTVGENVTLNNAGKLTVSATVDASKGAFVNKATIDSTETAGTLTVTGEGKVVVKTEIDPTVNAARYVTGTSTDKLYNYVTLDAALAAANAGTTKDIAVLGQQALTASATLPKDVKLDLKNATVAIGEDAKATGVTLTVASGASVKNAPASIAVYGTVYAEKKTDIDSAVRDKLTAGADVYSEELNEKGQAVRDGWAKWTNIATALVEAPEGSVVKITKDLTIKTDLTIPEKVTLDTNGKNVTVFPGVTITDNGTLSITNNDNKFVMSNDVMDGQDVKKKAAAFVLNGEIASNGEIKFLKGTYAKDSSGNESVTATEEEFVVGAAYYSITTKNVTKYYATTVEKAAPLISTVNEQKITLKGAELTVGDVSFEGMSAEEPLATVVVEAKKLTVSSITLANAKIEFTGGQTFQGTIKDAAGSIVLKGKVGNAVTTTDGTTEPAFAVESGKAFAVSGNFTGGKDAVVFSGAVSFVKGEIDNAKVEGTLTVCTAEDSTTKIKKIVVNGTVSIDAGATLDVDEAEVFGTIVGASETGETAGTLDVAVMYIGIASKDILVSSGAAASVTGNVTLSNHALVAPGTTVPEAFTKEGTDYKTTAFYIGDNLYLTAYANENTTGYIASVDAHIENARFDGWYNENGDKAVLNDGESDVNGTKLGSWTKVTAKVVYDIYKIVLKADEGIADVYLNGQAMYYGLVNGTNGYYYAYTATVSAGDYKVTYTLKNGWSGEAKLTGENVTGTSFKATGTPASGQQSISLVYQLSGVEKSGYVEPVTPSEDNGDDGLTITDYLLIVLVVLIVIMAVIVAMRLMRS